MEERRVKYDLTDSFKSKQKIRSNSIFKLSKIQSKNYIRKIVNNSDNRKKLQICSDTNSVGKKTNIRNLYLPNFSFGSKYAF